MSNGFLFTPDYNVDMQRHIDALFTAALYVGTSREQRLQAVDDLIEAYIAFTGKRPNNVALGRLGSLLLRDELTDATPYKTRNTEYPFESIHKEKRYNDGLTSFSHTETIGTDGRDYRVPYRRVRTPSENAHMDRHAQGGTRNANRKKT